MRLLPSRSSSSSSRICWHRGPVKFWPAVLGVLVVAGCGSDTPSASRATPTPDAAGEAARTGCRTRRAAGRRCTRSRRASGRAERARLRALARGAALADGRGVAARGAADRADHRRTSRAGCGEDWARANSPATRSAACAGPSSATSSAAVRALAASHQLTADRLDPTFLILNANVRFWPSLAAPGAGVADIVRARPGDLPVLPGPRPAVPAAGLVGAGERDRGRVPGGAAFAHEQGHLPDGLDDALAGPADRRWARGARAISRGSTTSPTGRGYPPWVSGMTQATAVQALSRGYRATGQMRWKRAAERALGAFEQPPPSGVACRPTAASTTSCTPSRRRISSSTAGCRR